MTEQRQPQATETPSVAEQNFFGANLSSRTYAVRTIQKIDRKIMAKEAELYGRKWFDYRPLCPAEATYLMAHFYNKAYANFMARCFDRGLIHMKAIKGKDFLEHREAKSFWRLRQKIDELGIRYDFFFSKAFNWYEARGWKKAAPRPSHMNSNDDLIIDVCNAWAEERNGKIQFATHRRYTAAEFVGAPDQIQYEQFIVAEIRRKPNFKYPLHSALYVFDAIRVETALIEFGAETVRGAINYCLSE